MSEKTVFWLGGKPGKAGATKPGIEQDEQFAAALRQVCESCGFEVRDYVAAQGAFGSWLVHMSKDGQKQRLVWNGKENQLLLEQAIEPGGWSEICTGEVAEHDVNGFVAAVQSVLVAALDPKS